MEKELSQKEIEFRIHTWESVQKYLRNNLKMLKNHIKKNPKEFKKKFENLETELEKSVKEAEEEIIIYKRLSG